jgi:hypothetical protein
MRSDFEFMPKHVTYCYLKNKYKKGHRIVVSRYGDGEYFIIKGEMGRFAKQDVDKNLIKLLNYSVRKKGQLICLPSKTKINLDNLYKDNYKKFSDNMSRYIIRSTKHSIYGQGQWRMIDLIHNKSEFITNFFLEKTLIVCGHKESAMNAFKHMNNIEIYGTPPMNATKEYEIISNDIKDICNNFRNIIFACGPLSKILIADLIDICNANLIDLGSIFGIIINPFSVSIPVVNMWSGLGKKEDKKILDKYSYEFFETINKK